MVLALQAYLKRCKHYFKAVESGLRNFNPPSPLLPFCCSVFFSFFLPFSCGTVSWWIPRCVIILVITLWRSRTVGLQRGNPVFGQQRPRSLCPLSDDDDLMVSFFPSSGSALLVILETIHLLDTDSPRKGFGRIDLSY